MSSSGQEVRKATVLVDYESAGDGRIAIITLNRPKKKNAFTEASYNEVAAQLRSADKDESVKAIVITGNGDYYSSGNDLSNFSKLMHPVTMAKAGRNILYDFVDAFLIRTPLVAAVNGPAFGIAVTTLGLCDEVIAAKSTKLKTPFAELGQAPEGCSSYTFPAIMGNEAANRILWDSENMTAETPLEVLMRELKSTEAQLREAEEKNAILDSRLTKAERALKEEQYVSKSLTDAGKRDKRDLNDVLYRLERVELRRLLDLALQPFDLVV